MKFASTSLKGALAVSLSFCSVACESEKVSTPPDTSPPAVATSEPVQKEQAAAASVDTTLGGQLFDNWIRARADEATFTADDAQTAAIDGQGGPAGNGSLADDTGATVPNTGHGYRLKNFFGWDLRGAEGIYGASYQAKSDVLPVNLLTDTRSSDELVAWFTHGGDGLPAFGDVLSGAEIASLAA